MRPRVSVVIPAYRNAKYLALTLDSILAQDFIGYEVIVADHSSDDDTSEVLARYASHPLVRVLSPTPRGGGLSSTGIGSAAWLRGNFSSWYAEMI